ncbi:hypothetical protein BALCAV_0217195 [Alkalihalobacillus alcalophilus ATCC 27647 = CGMCC 1.3604]|uniref:O-antigen polymerase n=1 Tax=Alkalihalobacillus alcalophilus ATCC 27647 = CGMCC 1.3604 TaxID=1218173 RepID=A0A094WK27_ALKAL|nr:hypothetical protein [Alkalihalobacillus alcalophilus]KGA96288.1 hypothetical protein BALCAV_0217195 [Alkalihalobacillus alcalophilus ATCC 27647 = CGMCC 1.3604]
MLFKNLKILYTIIILTLPITFQYSSVVPGISLGELFLVGVVFLCLIYMMLSKQKIKPISFLKNPFFWLVIYIIFISLISGMIQDTFSLTTVSTRIIRFVFYTICAIIISSQFFDFTYGIKIYKRFVILATSFLMVQIILYHSTGFILQGTIPGANMVNDFSYDRIQESLSRFYRPMSFFTEPGYYARYVLPFLAFCLFSSKLHAKYRTDMGKAIFITIGLFLSGSGQGILLGIFLWAGYFITKGVDISTFRIRIRYLIGGLALPIISFFILQFDHIQRSLDRLWGGPMASSNLRVYRGFAVYEQFPLLEKFIGVGYGNSGNYIEAHGIYTQYDFPGMPEYMNSVAYILTGTGIIGLLILLWTFVFMYKKQKVFIRRLL